MPDIFYKPKIDDSASFKCKLRNLVHADNDQCSIIVPYGIQERCKVTIPKQIRLCLHSTLPGAHNIIVHYGAGVCNKVSVWTLDGDDYKARKVVPATTLENTVHLIKYGSFDKSKTSIRSLWQRHFPPSRQIELSKRPCPF